MEYFYSFLNAAGEEPIRKIRRAFPLAHLQPGCKIDIAPSEDVVMRYTVLDVIPTFDDECPETLAQHVLVVVERWVKTNT